MDTGGNSPSEVEYEAGSMLSDWLDTMGPTWKEALKDEFTKDYFKHLTEFLDKELSDRKILNPLIFDIFSWTRFFTVAEVKVVIVGQEPYTGEDEADGLCFCLETLPEQPSSLRNIFKALENDPGVVFKTPDGNLNGDLSGWAKQGVLLLNTVLTVESGKPNSHRDRGWEIFTDAVIRIIASSQTGVVWMLWGQYAQQKKMLIDELQQQCDVSGRIIQRHLVLCSYHPSPRSARLGFLTCQHFSQANRFLRVHGRAEINWQL